MNGFIFAGLTCVVGLILCMVSIIKKTRTIKKGLHIHIFNEAIVSQYRSFHTRNIIFQCRCGAKEMREVHCGFSEPFPIQTASMITNAEMKRILENPEKLKPIISTVDLIELFHH